MTCDARGPSGARDIAVRDVTIMTMTFGRLSQCREVASLADDTQWQKPIEQTRDTLVIAFVVDRARPFCQNPSSAASRPPQTRRRKIRSAFLSPPRRILSRILTSVSRSSNNRGGWMTRPEATTRRNLYAWKPGKRDYRWTPRDHFCDRTGSREVASAHFRRMRHCSARHPRPPPRGLSPRPLARDIKLFKVISNDCRWRS